MLNLARTKIHQRSRNLAFFLIRITALPFLMREIWQRRKVTILAYHDLRPETADRYFTCLKSLYNVIALKDYVKARQTGTIEKLPPKSLILTLDDGHKANYALQEVIKKHKIPITIVLCSGIVGTTRHFWFKHVPDRRNLKRLKGLADKERLTILAQSGFEERQEFGCQDALADHEIDEMKPIVDFQSHTIFHPILPRCTDERAIKEIYESKKELEKKYGLDIYAICYPNGDYTEREISMAKNAGYECGLTLDAGFNSQHTDLFRLKRTCISDDAGINEVVVKASGFWGYLRKLLLNCPRLLNQFGAAE